jgi:hypothetical protein
MLFDAVYEGKQDILRVIFSLNTIPDPAVNKTSYQLGNG